jgi:hypothetical protein
MNWKGCGRKGSWPNFSYYSGISLERLRKTRKSLSQDSMYPNRDIIYIFVQCNISTLNKVCQQYSYYLHSVEFQLLIITVNNRSE